MYKCITHTLHARAHLSSLEKSLCEQAHVRKTEWYLLVCAWMLVVCMLPFFTFGSYAYIKCKCHVCQNFCTHAGRPISKHVREHCGPLFFIEIQWFPFSWLYCCCIEIQWFPFFEITYTNKKQMQSHLVLLPCHPQDANLRPGCMPCRPECQGNRRWQITRQLIKGTSALQR